MPQWMRTNKLRFGAVLVAVLVFGGTIVAFFDQPGPSSSARARVAVMPRSEGPITKSVGTATPTTIAADAAPSPIGGASAKIAPAANDASSGIVVPEPPVTTVPDLAPIGSKIVKNGSLTVQVKRNGLDASLGRVLTIVGDSGGAVQSSESAGRTATFVLRIPVNKFESAVVELRKLGKITANSLKSDEVTAQYVDLDSRLRNLQAQAAVLLDLMHQAKTIPDTIAVQQQLSQLQGQIEELQGQRRVLDDQTSFATLTVSISEKGAAIPVHHKAQPESQLARSWHHATDTALAIVGGMIVLLGAAVPLTLILLPIAGVIIVMRRRQKHVAATT